MKLFQKRETLLQNMALMGIMAAINIIVAVLAAFFPVISILLVLILPLSSTLVEIFCKDKYYPIYAFATIGLSLVATLWNMETTIFYIIPSIATGYIFGLMSKKNIPSIYSILAASVLQAGITIAFIPFINFVFDVDFIDTFLTFFKVSDFEYVRDFVLAFIFAISSVQITLSYIIVSNEIKKFGIEPNERCKYPLIYQIGAMVFALLEIPFAYFYVPASYLCMMISLYLGIFILVDFIYDKKWFAFGLCLGGIGVDAVVFISANSTLDGSLPGLLVGVIPFWIGFISVAFSLLKRDAKKIK